MDDRRMTKRYLDMAARAGLRGRGDVEPNPMVGAVIVRRGVDGREDQILGIGHHCRFGGLHAEREALKNARDNGFDVAGSTVYSTLEPCCHHGKQPPCSEALIEAGVGEVVYARRDPAEVSSGGHELLEAAGIKTSCVDVSPLAYSISDPFVHTVGTGLPWVVAKWAQTIDGKIATSTGESQWISNERSRGAVHRMRSRMDAVGVGMGTVVADDPMLTARGVRRVRRSATRIVFDTHGRFPEDSKLAETAGVYQTVICTSRPEYVSVPGIRVLECPAIDGRLDLRAALRMLNVECKVSNILIEAGPRLLGSLLDADLIDEAVVHLAAGIMGDDSAKACATGRDCSSLDQMKRFSLRRVKRVGDDVHLHYRK